MTVSFLARMLFKETVVIIKDMKSRKTVWCGTAEKAIFRDKVKDWDFSKQHIIYI